MNVSPISRYIRRTIKIVVGVVLFSIVGVAVLLGLLWLDHNRETTLPMPTGPFVVGRTMYTWSDAAQADPLAPQSGTKRELLAWIWYPAAPRQPSQIVDDYLPAPWRTAILPELARRPSAEWFRAFRGPASVHRASCHLESCFGSDVNNFVALIADS